MSGPLRVAAGQAEAVSGDVGANVAAAVRLLGLAADRGAHLLVLPEAFPTGYDEAVFAGALPTPAELPRLLAPLVAAAVARAVTVVLSCPLRRGGTSTMTTVVLRPDGRVTTPYDKQHLDADERVFFTAGDHGASIVVDGLELGLAICYDSSFPEHARHAADDGAVAYLVSGAFFPGSERRRDTVLAARALDNGVYVVAAGATGRTGAQDFVGGSCVVDPAGEVVGRLGTEEGVVVADLDPAVVAATRARRTMHADRRADLGGRTRE